MNKRLQEKIKIIETNLQTLTGIVKELVQSLDEPKAVDEPVKPVKWRAEPTTQYWYIDSAGHIDSAEDIDWSSQMGRQSDSFRYLTGNYYKTRKEAEQALEVIKAKGRLYHAYYALVGDWKPDFESLSFDKFYIEYYNLKTKKFSVNCYYNGLAVNPLRDFCFKSNDLANQFIKENEADLKLVFGLTQSIND